jgi:hypothetical protein
MDRRKIASIRAVGLAFPMHPVNPSRMTDPRDRILDCRLRGR